MQWNRWAQKTLATWSGSCSWQGCVRRVPGLLPPQAPLLAGSDAARCQAASGILFLNSLPVGWGPGICGKVCPSMHTQPSSQ